MKYNAVGTLSVDDCQPASDSIAESTSDRDIADIEIDGPARRAARSA